VFKLLAYSKSLKLGEWMKMQLKELLTAIKLFEVI
jgi:hypothetical protein